MLRAAAEGLDNEPDVPAYFCVSFAEDGGVGGLGGPGSLSEILAKMPPEFFDNIYRFIFVDVARAARRVRERAAKYGIPLSQRFTDKQMERFLRDVRDEMQESPPGTTYGEILQRQAAAGEKIAGYALEAWDDEFLKSTGKPKDIKGQARSSFIGGSRRP